jgi:hypothetical protein
VAKPSRIGTSTSNSRSGVASSNAAPNPAPIMEASAMPIKARSSGGNCERSLRAANSAPGTAAVKLQMVAGSGGMPDAISAG